MDLDALQSVLGWTVVINCVLYAITVLAVVSMRDWMSKLHARLFGIDPAKAASLLYTYCAFFKIAIIVFSFVPWLAVVIVNAD